MKPYGCSFAGHRSRCTLSGAVAPTRRAAGQASAAAPLTARPEGRRKQCPARASVRPAQESDRGSNQLGVIGSGTPVWQHEYVLQPDSHVDAGFSGG